nr:uncharacterized protein LOC100175027 isoform X2 [Ciona intestinalis]|eukprot:XP_026691680.1 uncharacterized protein LOC100175027 isoform X2 [Ciona intestinalis]
MTEASQNTQPSTSARDNTNRRNETQSGIEMDVQTGETVSRITAQDVHIHNYQRSNAVPVIPPSPVMTPEEAIRRVMENNRNHIEGALDVIDKHNVDLSQIPVVHPLIENTWFFGGEAALADEEYNPSTFNRYVQANIRFDQLLEQRHEFKRMAIIGYPGSGKTTCSRRLAENGSLYCFHLKFMDMNYTEKLTLQQLLIDNQHPELTREVCDLAFRWILDNQEQCVFIFDGYDQVRWSITNAPPKCRITDKLEVSVIVGNLFQKRFLQHSMVIFTSRPHSLVSLHKSVWPDLTVHLWEFSYDDMKRLFRAFAGHRAEDIWNTLESSAPQLIGICHNPLMLQYTIMACLNPSRHVGDIITITRVFSTVLENLAHSEYSKADNNIYEIRDQLSVIAYKATSEKKVVISHEDLLTQDLDIKKVQDLVIVTPGYKGIGSRIFEGELKVYFTHQCTQEYLTAWYIKYHMGVEEFSEFCQNKLFTGHWSTVRRFLCGLLVDDQTTTHRTGGLSVADIARKRQVLLEKLIPQTTMNTDDLQNPGHYQIVNHNVRERFTLFKSQLGDVRECNNDNVTEQAVREFPAHLIFTGIRFTTSEAFALGYVMKKVRKTITRLELHTCYLTSDQFRHIADGIKAMPGSIETLILISNTLAFNAVDAICGILPKITKYFKMWEAFIDDDQEPADLYGDDISRVQDALDAIPNTNLKIYTSRDRILQKQNTSTST